MSAPALRLHGVTVGHEPDEPPVLSVVSFEVAAGERVALLGLNGSGKTTLLMAAVGLLPCQGTVEVGGDRLGPRTLARVRARTGFLFNVPEDQLLFPTAEEDVAFGPSRQGLSPDEARVRAGEVLAALGVGALARAPLHHLSHGQKQRVALAGALAARPPLLLLDEPSAGLDPPGRSSLAAFLAAAPAAQLVATHDLDFVERFCTRFLLLEGGRLALDEASAAGVRSRWAEAPPARKP